MGQNLLAVLSYGPELSHYLSSEHDPSEFKYHPTQEDIKTFKIITRNQFFNDLDNNQEFKDYQERPSLDWQQEKDMMFLIYKEFKKTEVYASLTDKPYEEIDNIELAKGLYKYLLLDSVEFEQIMEDKNIFWYDEKIPILKSIERVFSELEEKTMLKIPNLFRNENEDLAMADDLVEKYFEHKTELEDALGQYTPGWDSERITKIDYLLMLMALLEFKYMPMIPVKVTLNEYIEIAKMYSTPKSSKFLNGTLDKILKDWKEQNLIKKQGRGLIG